MVVDDGACERGPATSAASTKALKKAGEKQPLVQMIDLDLVERTASCTALAASRPVQLLPHTSCVLHVAGILSRPATAPLPSTGTEFHVFHHLHNSLDAGQSGQ